MNKFICCGNAVRDPESKATQSGKKVLNFTIAVNEGKDKDGKQRTEYFDFTAWEKLAEVCEKYMYKGGKYLVTAHLHKRTYEKDGEKRYITDFVAETVEFLSSKREEQPQEQNYYPAPDTGHAEYNPEQQADDELPF